MPDLDNLSLHEQQILADEEHYRKKGVIPFTGYIRPKPTAAEQDETNRLNAARALPDTLFDGDIEVQRLRAILHTKMALIKSRISVRDWLALQMVKLDETIRDAERIVQDALLEDAEAGDEGFTKTRKATSALDLAKAVREASDAAYAIVAPSSPSAQKALYDARDAARIALEEHIFALKKAYVNASARVDQGQEGGV